MSQPYNHTYERRLSLWLCVMGVLACRPSSTPVMAAGPAALQVTETVPEPAPVPAAPAGEPAPRPMPPALQHVTPLELPFPEGTVVVSPMVTNRPVVLFPDEENKIRLGVANRLRVLGHPIAPMVEVAQIEQAAAQGRLILEGDQACRATLTSMDVAHRYFRGLPVADPEAESFGGLGVDVKEPAAEDGDRGWSTSYSGVVKRPHDPRSWFEAAHQLTLSHGGGGSMGGGGRGSAHHDAIEFRTVDSIGPWAAPPDQSDVSLPSDRLVPCAQTGRQQQFAWQVRLAVSADGSVKRCAATSVHAQALPANGACLCLATQDLQFPRGRAGRRMRLKAVDDGRHRQDVVGFKMLQPSTEPWVRRLDQSTVLEECNAAFTPPPGLTTTAVLALELDGSISDAQIFGDIEGVQTMSWANCMVRQLPFVALPCRPPGIDQLQVTIVASAPA